MTELRSRVEAELDTLDAHRIQVTEPGDGTVHVRARWGGAVTEPDTLDEAEPVRVEDAVQRLSILECRLHNTARLACHVHPDKPVLVVAGEREPG